jgi:ketosteroid isomerase-like protein
MLYFAAVAAAFVTGLCLAQDMNAVEKNWASKVLAADTAALDRMMADDIIYAHASGVIDTKASYLEKLKSKRQVYKTLEHQKKLETRMHGDTAITHGVIRVTGINPAGNFDDTVMMIHVWVKRGGEWKLAAHQTTKIK